MTARRAPIHRGAGLFAEAAEPEHHAKHAAYTANIDGGSRGNPGPAAYGVVIRDPRGEVVAHLKKYIGRATNNVAEYYGLIAALDYAQSHGVRALRIESDSELLVNQMRGRYKVKSADLKPLFERARKMSRSFDSFRIEHVYREKNAEADKLANEALDETSGPGKARQKYFSGKMLNAQDLSEEQQYGLEKHKLRGRVVAGALQLAEKLDLPDGTEVEIAIRPAPKR